MWNKHSTHEISTKSHSAAGVYRKRANPGHWKNFWRIKEAQRIYQDINLDKETKYKRALPACIKKDQMRFINYKFDYNFNMIDQSEELVNLKDIPNHKYKPARYKGEEYEVVGLSVDPNIMGTLVLKKNDTKFSFNWFQLRYTLNTTVEGKLKATTDDDKKFFYWDHIEDNTDGTAMILVGEKQKLAASGQCFDNDELPFFEVWC